MKTEEEIAAGNNTLKLILRRINQPTIEPMEAVAEAGGCWGCSSPPTPIEPMEAPQHFSSMSEEEEEGGGRRRKRKEGGRKKENEPPSI